MWRGYINTPVRNTLLETHGTSDTHDIAAVGKEFGKEAYLTPEAHLERQVILSLEGNDVATNLKWAMGTQSLVMTPALKFETWYLEGCLQPGVHFAEVKPDLSDLDEATGYFERNPDKALNIIAAANDWRARFHDQETEDIIAAAVIRKYLDMYWAKTALKLFNSP